MQAVVLGAAAGGGFPQWNSGSAACQRARAGDPAAKPRTQASLAVSGDGEHWAILNASPDLRQQIEATHVLHPPAGRRGSPISAVLLTGGDVDAIAGLLVLREGHAFALLAAAPVLDILAANPIFEVLDRRLVTRTALPLDTPAPLGATGLTATLFAVPGKVPLYAETDDAPAIAADGRSVGAAISDGRRTLFFIPGCAAMTDAIAARLRGADFVAFDATLWQDDEMIRQNIGRKTGRRMGHMSLTGPDGSFVAFAGLGVRRKMLLHINNSNPILLADSPERAAAEAQGWIVAEDGMRIDL